MCTEIGRYFTAWAVLVTCRLRGVGGEPFISFRKLRFYDSWRGDGTCRDNMNNGSTHHTLFMDCKGFMRCAQRAVKLEDCSRRSPKESFRQDHTRRVIHTGRLEASHAGKIRLEISRFSVVVAS